MEKKIAAFLSGYGSGSVYGYDNGSGSGDDNGSGDGSGSGYVYGAGDGAGDGAGAGAGDGTGTSSGYGSGSSSGYGERIAVFHGKKVCYVDSIPCIFESVHDTWASVFVIEREDFTEKKAFLAKLDGQIAHGETIKKAFTAAMEKALDGMDIEEKKASFREKFPLYIEPYHTMDFFTWHHVLTGSCEFGRKQFAEEHNIDLDGKMTVKQFCCLTANAYNGSVIQQLEALYR